MNARTLTFNGFDPASPTLMASPLGGDCMGPAFAKWRTCYLDRSAPIASADLVRFHMRYADGTSTCIVKELHCTRDGRWWGRCHDGVFEIGVAGKPRTLAQPFFVEKVVALSEEYYAPTPRVVGKATDEEAALYARLSADAVTEWAQHGFPIGIHFPGLAPDGFAQ